MTASVNSKLEPLIFSMVALWAAIAIIGMVVLVRANIQVFDADETTAKNFSSINDYFDALEMNLSSSNGEPLLIRIVEPGCRCNLASGAHWRHLEHEYEDVNFEVIELSSLSPAARQLIPATPMAVFIDSEQQALYAGPFSDALYCNSDNSLVEKYVEGVAKVPFAPLQTEGCFCQT